MEEQIQKGIATVIEDIHKDKLREGNRIRCNKWRKKYPDKYNSYMREYMKKRKFKGETNGTKT